MKTVEAELLIQVHVNCPECDDLIDLLDPDDTDGQNHDEEGFVIRQAMDWDDGHRFFAVEGVTCTGCKTEFNVRKIIW